MKDYSISELIELIKALSISKVTDFKYGELEITIFPETTEDIKPEIVVSTEIEKEIKQTVDNANEIQKENDIKRELSELYYENPSEYEDAILEGIIVKEEVKDMEEIQE